MARISGVDLPKDKRVEIGLTYIYGIGRKSAKDILEKAGIIVTIRKSLGMDIQAACGQLAGKEQKPQIKAD